MTLISCSCKSEFPVAGLYLQQCTPSDQSFTPELVCLTPQDLMTKCMQSHEHQYVFEPVCASVLLRRNTSKEPLRPRNSPRIEVQVQLEPTSLRMSQVCSQSLRFTLATAAH